MSTKQETKAKKPPVADPSVTLEWETDPSDRADIELIGGLNIVGPGSCATVTVRPGQGVRDVADAIVVELDANRGSCPFGYGDVEHDGNGIILVSDTLEGFYFHIKETFDGQPCQRRIPDHPRKLRLACGMRVTQKRTS